MKLVYHHRGTICGIGIIVDRSSSEIDLHEEFFSVTKQVANIFSPEDIPDSLKNIPPTKPGSKNIDV